MRMIWFRALMMTISLTFVIFAIRSLNRSGLNPDVASALGTPGSVTTRVNLPGRLDWCETRVESLKLSNDLEIRQEGMRWFKIAGSTKSELNPISMEKWLSLHCTVESELTRVESAEIPARLMTVTFIKGEPQTLLRYPSGEFVWNGQAFKSKDLAAALQELEQLPAVGSTSVDKK